MADTYKTEEVVKKEKEDDKYEIEEEDGEEKKNDKYKRGEKDEKEKKDDKYERKEKDENEKKGDKYERKEKYEKVKKGDKYEREEKGEKEKDEKSMKEKDEKEFNKDARMDSGPKEECFLPALNCCNCERKGNFIFQDKNKTHSNEKSSQKVYWRCADCILMSYCDEACQLEHWTHVHRYHCPYLLGQKVMEGHNEESCQNCIEKKTSEREELLSINSPKIGCKIQEESKQMRKDLGRMFGFHEIGRNHICSVEFGCHHPFPMGRIPGKLVCTGMDEMIVHAAKLSNALIVKTMNDKVTPKETIGQLLQLHKRIRNSRLILWEYILIFGGIHRSAQEIDKQLSEITESLDKIYDNDNVWWRALAFTIRVIISATHSQNRASPDSTRMTDPKLLEIHDFHTNQVANISSVSQNKAWHLFKLWPTLVNQSLKLVLPQDTSCATCKEDLSGQTVDPENNSLTNINPHSVLYPRASNEGGLVVACPPAKKVRCVMELLDNFNEPKWTDEATKEWEVTNVTKRACHLCLRRSLSTHRCQSCLAVQYCSKECVTQDFAFHKTVCSDWAKDPTRKLMSGKQQKKWWKSFVEENNSTK